MCGEAHVIVEIGGGGEESDGGGGVVAGVGRGTNSQKVNIKSLLTHTRSLSLQKAYLLDILGMLEHTH